VTDVTGLRLPKGTSVCFGQGVDKIRHRGDCKPRTSGESWKRARGTQPYDKLPRAAQLDNGWDTSLVPRTVAEHYLGRPYYKDGSIGSSCTEWSFFDAQKDNIYAPITTTDLTEVYRDRAVDVAVVMVRGAARTQKVPNRKRFVADFSAYLHKVIEQEAKSSAKIVYIQTNWNGGVREFVRHDELAGCIAEASEGAPVITGIGGIITYGLHTDVRVYQSKHFQTALRAAFRDDQSSFVHDLSRSLSIRWEDEINREIQSHVRQESEQPVFHPLWIQTEKVSRKNVAAAKELHRKAAASGERGREDERARGPGYAGYAP
jgi:hypothetical protein